MKKGRAKMTVAYCSEAGKKSAAYKLLRLAVEREYKIDMPKIEKYPSGKPYFPDRPDIFFSLSHTKTHVLCILSDSPCGCDIETIRQVSAGTPGRVCTQQELSQLDFFRLWTLKESFIKISGNAPKNLRDISFSVIGDTIIPPDPDFSAASYDVPGCACSVICKGAPPEKIIFISCKNLS